MKRGAATTVTAATSLMALPDEAARLLATPAPPVDTSAAEIAVERHYGLRGAAEPLAAERDRNFMVTLADGSRRVLKVFHEAEDPGTRAFQTGLLEHMERVGVACRVPRLVPTRDGAPDCAIAADGRDYRAVLLSVVPGAPCDLARAGPAMRRAVGRAAAAIGEALADYDHPAASRVMLWDPMQLGRLAFLVERIAEPARRRWLDRVVERFVVAARPEALRLPTQVIHNDLNGSNVFVDGEGVSGVIDFGDAVRAPRINDVAIAANYAMAADRDPVASVGDVLDGYDAARPVGEAEAALLLDLVVARLAQRMLMYQWRTELFPESRAYILRNGAALRDLADTFATIAPDAGRDAILRRWRERKRAP